MVKLQTIGTGEEIELSEFASLSSILPILYNHRDKQMQTALLQGMPSVTAGGDQVTIDFQALYGFYPAPQFLTGNEPGIGDGFSGKARESNAGYDLRGEILKETVKGDLERSAFKYGAHIFRACFKLLAKMQLTGSMQKYATVTSHVDGIKYVEVVIDTLNAMRDRVIDNLENQVVLFDRLRDNRGHYRWIGLRTRGVELTTPMKLPKLIGGQRDLFLSASVMPSDGNSFIRPRDDNVANAVVSGMIHGLEGRTQWNAETAIRASIFHHTYGDAVSPELIFSAGSRAGLSPRLGSTIRTSGGTKGKGAWQYLAALALAYDFFRTYYITSFGQPVGSVQYGFSGGGVAQILENKIKRYISSSSVSVKDEVNPSPGGLVHFPSTNAPSQQYAFGFVRRRPGAWTSHDKSMTRITQYDGETISANFESTPTKISSEMFLLQSEEQRNNDNWKPVVISSVPSVIKQREYVGSGLHVTRMRVKDRFDPHTVLPSELLSSLLTGWQHAYEPSGLIFTDNPVGSNIKDMFALTPVLTTKGAGYTAP